MSDSFIVEPGFGEGVGRQAAAQLLQHDPPPTAIFVCRHDLGVDVIREIKARGLRCPEDVEVVAFGDDPSLAVVEPAVTALDNLFSEMGHAAAGLLFDVMEDTKAPPKQIRVPCRLIQRHSSRAYVGGAERMNG